MLTCSDTYTDTFDALRKELETLIIGNNADDSEPDHWKSDFAVGLCDVSDSLSENSLRIRKDIEKICSENISVSYNSVENKIYVSGNSIEEILDPQEFWNQYEIISRDNLDKMNYDIGTLQGTFRLLNLAQTNLLRKTDRIKLKETNFERDIKRIISNQIIKPIENNISAEQKRLQDDAVEMG